MYRMVINNLPAVLLFITVTAGFAVAADEEVKPLPVLIGIKPIGASDRSVYARTAASVTNVTSDIYRVIVGPVEMQQMKIAVVLLNNSVSGVAGVLMLSQARNDGPVHINGSISGLTPGKHGFHVHQTGDLRDGCASTLGHFNPHMQPHGSPRDKNRHNGDLGNIEAGPDGVANIDLADSIISLFGPHTIIGRSIVVHEKEDDLGKVNDEGSMKTGNAGGRLVCGIIGTVQ